MRLFAASAVCVLSTLASSAAFAGDPVVASNLPVARTYDPVTGRYLRDGTFSDALQSNGNYFYTQALGQSFSIGSGQSSVLSGVTWWGSSEYLNSSTPWNQSALSSNIIGMQVAILRTDTGTANFPIVQSWTFQIGQITQLTSGTFTPETFSPVFQLSAALTNSVSLSAGNYMITIGGVLLNPEGDAFAWTDGAADGSLPATQAYATVGDIPSEWGTWLPVTDGTSGAFVLQGTTIPAPATLALLGLSALGKRRRRNN